MESPVNSEIFSHLSDTGMDSLPKSDRILLKHKNNIKLYTNGTNRTKIIVFWIVLALLLLLSIGNFILTVTIFSVLNMGLSMESMEILKDFSLVKFYGLTDLDRIYKRDGQLEGFNDIPMNIIGNDGPIVFDIATYRNKKPENKIIFDLNGTIFRNVKKFVIRDPLTKKVIFTTEAPKIVVKDPVRNLRAKVVNTNKITSSINQNLNVFSNSKVHLRGTEGANIDSKTIVWSADQDIYMKSINGSIMLVSNDVKVNVKRIPIVEGEVSSNSAAQFKLCVCMPQGKLYRILVPLHQPHKANCALINFKFTDSKLNPCI